MAEAPIFDTLFCEYVYDRRTLPREIIWLFTYGSTARCWHG